MVTHDQPYRFLPDIAIDLSHAKALHKRTEPLSGKEGIPVSSIGGVLNFHKRKGEKLVGQERS